MAEIQYFSRERINICATTIITLIVLIILVVPIWLLFHLTVALKGEPSTTTIIGILVVSTLLFSAVVSLFTGAKRHEILAASAG